MEDTQKINIVFLYSAAQYGGLVRNLNHIAKSIDTKKFCATFIALHGPEQNPEEIGIAPREGVVFHPVTDVAKLDAAALRTLAAYLAESDCQILSAHGHKADVYAFLLKYLWRAPVSLVSIAHGWVVPGFKMKCYDVLDKIALWFFDKVILLGEFQRKELFLLSSGKTELVPNAIEQRETISMQQRNAARAQLSLEDAELVFAYCGRMSPEKGVDILLRALAQIPREDIVLLLVGDGPERVSLERLKEALHLGSRVHFCGFVEDVYSILAAADFYVSASRREGLPNNVLEAQAVGLACALSAIDSHCEIAGGYSLYPAVQAQEQTSLLFETDSVEDCAACIRALVESAQLRTQLGVKGQARVRTEYCLRTRIARLEKVYETLSE